MANEAFFALLLNLLIKLQAFVLRPSVQIQLVAILAILVGIGFVSNIVIVAIGKRQKTAPVRQGGEPSGEGETADFVLILSTGTKLLVFPLLALITTNIVIFLLQAQNRAAGLLRLLGFILLVLLTYRLFLLLLYLAFPKDKVRRFQTRLFSPLFALFVLYQIVQLFVNVRALGTVALFADLLENPMTLGALFLATVGLYFWIDSILGLREIIFDTLSRFTSFNQGRIDASLTLASYILIGAGIAIALNLLGVSSTSFAAILGGLSVGIGFAMKEVLSNFASGILLLFEGSIKPGDWVKVGGQDVLVKKLGIRATVVRDRNNVEVIVPNEKLLTAPVTSYTSTDSIVRIQIPLRGSYNSDPEEITQILLQTARQNPNVLAEPKSAVVITEFSDTGIHYLLHIWIDLTKSAPPGVKNQLYRAINKAFAEHDIDWIQFVKTPPSHINLIDSHDSQLKIASHEAAMHSL